MSLNLTGDPEMPLWWRRPLTFRVPEVILWDRLRMILDPPEPPDPTFDLPYRRNWGLTHVHLRQGRQEQLVVVGPDGGIDMPLADFHAGAATLTVSRPGHQPVVRRVEIRPAQNKAARGAFMTALMLLGGLASGAFSRGILRREAVGDRVGPVRGRALRTVMK